MTTIDVKTERRSARKVLNDLSPYQRETQDARARSQSVGNH
jgi:hypothetical protein